MKEGERNLGGQFLETHSDCNRARMPCLSVSVWGRSHCTGEIRCSPFLLVPAPSARLCFLFVIVSFCLDRFYNWLRPIRALSPPLPFPTAACQAAPPCSSALYVCRRPSPCLFSCACFALRGSCRQHSSACVGGPICPAQPACRRRCRRWLRERKRHPL